MKLENLDKMDKILDIYGYPKPNQQNINYLNRSITWNEFEVARKSVPKKKIEGSDRVSAKFYQSFREELTPIFLKLPWSRKGSNTAKHIVWIQHYTHPYIGQGHTKIIWLQANLFNEHRCKNPQ
jgi:hypothetical protein